MRFGITPTRTPAVTELDRNNSHIVNKPSREASRPTVYSANDAPTTVSPSIWRRVRRDIVLLGAGSVGIVIAQLGFRSILIVALVPSAYGRLSLILSIYNTVTILGASGLPNGTARYIAAGDPADDSAIVRSAVRANIWPTIVTAAIVGGTAGILLHSALACLLGMAGLSSLVYSLLATGILRGRGRPGAAASILPIASFSEVGLLAAVWFLRGNFTPTSAFALFCLGNVIGLVVAIIWTVRTAPSRIGNIAPLRKAGPNATPSSRQLLGLSLWLGAATVGVTIMPLVMRFAAALDSYSIVAMIDVALVLLTIPQRVGTVIVAAVVPHATRALGEGDGIDLTITRREHAILIIPFVIASLIVAFTPLIGWGFDLLGRPEYSKAAGFLALALLAGPARILYGLVQGVLIAHNEGRFLAVNALVITSVASGLIFATTALGHTMVAFAIFVVACWAVYLNGLTRIHRLTSIQEPLTNGTSA
jgi:O-antigen/teichoic acid export membrane protein